MIERAIKSKTLFNNIHWHLFCEWNNKDNNELIRTYFERVYLEFMAAVERESPEYTRDIKTALELRSKVMALSEVIKGRTDIKVDGKNALL